MYCCEHEKYTYSSRIELSICFLLIIEKIQGDCDYELLNSKKNDVMQRKHVSLECSVVSEDA